jgi:2-polyprenyl-6-methoxyphenol hydroxylase-like FAD-dependent oxidoreductase
MRRQFDRELIDVEYAADGVIARFKDGTFDKGTIIIGADGGQSPTRRMLLGALATPEIYPDIEMVNLNVVYSYEQAKFIIDNMAPHVDYGVHPKGIFFITIRKIVSNFNRKRKS